MMSAPSRGGSAGTSTPLRASVSRTLPPSAAPAAAQPQASGAPAAPPPAGGAPAPAPAAGEPTASRRTSAAPVATASGASVSAYSAVHRTAETWASSSTYCSSLRQWIHESIVIMTLYNPEGYIGDIRYDH
jgi:hypothetical protein